MNTEKFSKVLFLFLLITAVLKGQEEVRCSVDFSKKDTPVVVFTKMLATQHEQNSLKDCEEITFDQDSFLRKVCEKKSFHSVIEQSNYLIAPDGKFTFCLKGINILFICRVLAQNFPAVKILYKTHGKPATEFVVSNEQRELPSINKLSNRAKTILWTSFAAFLASGITSAYVLAGKDGIVAQAAFTLCIWFYVAIIKYSISFSLKAFLKDTLFCGIYCAILWYNYVILRDNKPGIIYNWKSFGSSHAFKSIFAMLAMLTWGALFFKGAVEYCDQRRRFEHLVSQGGTTPIVCPKESLSLVEQWLTTQITKKDWKNAQTETILAKFFRTLFPAAVIIIGAVLGVMQVGKKDLWVLLEPLDPFKEVTPREIRMASPGRIEFKDFVRNNKQILRIAPEERDADGDKKYYCWLCKNEEEILLTNWVWLSGKTGGETHACKDANDKYVCVNCLIRCNMVCPHCRAQLPIVTVGGQE